MPEKELRSFWGQHFKPDWKFGVFLLALVCVPRFILVLKANQFGNYGAVGAIMLVSALIPYVFLNKYGRSRIGIKPTKEFGFLLLSFALGVAFSLLLHVVGKELYGASFQNWYAYIGKSYNIPQLMSAGDKLVLFLVMAATGMIFSPIGEELYFRGIVHRSFANSLGDQRASIVDGLAFAVTHIAHFGLVYVGGKWSFYVVPATIWLAAMFVASLVFFQMRKLTQSLLGAVVCHAGFNLGMIYCIFYLI